MKKFGMAVLMALWIGGAALAGGETRVEENMSWFRLHLGQGVGEKALSAEEIQKFINAEITPRFIEGLTITDARGQWNAPEGLIMERTTVVDIQAPNTEEAREKVEAIALTYVERYQDARTSIYVVRIDNTQNVLYYRY